MGYATNIRRVRHCRKPYLCDWCGERIKLDDAMSTWGWFTNGSGTTIRVHPECHDAMLEDAGHGYFEFSPGENRRGCNCGRDADCERCKENKRINKED